MSTFTIPNSQGGIRQDNHGDTRGELFESYNIDLSTTTGKILSSKKLEKGLDEVTHLDDGIPQAFEFYDREVYMATDDGVFRCSIDDDITDSANWSEETGISGSGIGFRTDMVTFGGLLLISQDTNITSWDGSSDDTSWWTSTVSGSALTGGIGVKSPHIMHVHRGGQETLFVTDKNLVRYYNATAGHSTVTLQTDLVATCVSSGVSAVWVGTNSDSISDAYVYEIYVGEQLDGTPIARNAYKIDGRAVLSINVVDNVPYIITDRGNIQVFNGAGFKTVASFPFAFIKDNLEGVRIGSVSLPVYTPVHPKGMQRYGDSLYININTQLESDNDKTPNRTPSGVWEFNTATGSLNHRYALSEGITDYGAYIADLSGPIMIANTDETFLLVVGAQNNGTAGIYAESSNTNQSYFVTPEIMSGTVQDSYESAYMKAKTLGAGESIKMKYRTTKRDKQYVDAVWEAENILNFAINSNVQVGDEVTVLYGAGAGKIAHITAISESSTRMSATIDSNIGTTGESVSVSVENWTLHPVTYDSDGGEYIKLGVGETSPWVQYKVVMLGDIEFRQFISKGNAKTEL